MADKYMTVVETAEFIRFAKEYLTEGERKELIDYLASNPTAGDLIRETGGSEPKHLFLPMYRVIYFFYNETIPLFMISGFAKNVMENISPAARKQYAKLLKELVKQYKGAN